jgi:hypothetical protein
MLDTKAIVCGDHRAVDEMALVGTQHDDQCVEVLGLSDPSSWQHVNQFLTRLCLPGHMAFTLMPKRPHSSAIALVIWTTADLLMQ